MKVAHDLHTIVLKCLLWWTCHSEVTSAGLSRTGLISGLIGFLPVYVQMDFYKNVRDQVFPSLVPRPSCGELL